MVCQRHPERQRRHQGQGAAGSQKRIWMAVVLTFCLLLDRCYWVSGQEPQIINGTEIGDSDYRWFAGIQRVVDEKFQCGASVIGSRYVLTANHCVVDGPTSVRVEVGYLCVSRDNCGRPNKIFGVRELHRLVGGDLALLVLDGTVDSLGIIPAVPYLGPELHPNQRRSRKMTLVGAGREATNGDISFRVEMLQVKYLPPNRCLRKLSNQALFTDGIICSTALGGGNPCRGDSGSPLVVRSRQPYRRRDLLVAVHIFGPVDCSNPKKSKTPLGHLQVSAAADLLQQVICRSDTPEDWCVTRLGAQLIHNLTDHNDAVLSLDFDKVDGSRLVSAGCQMKLWDPLAGGPALTSVIDGLSENTTNCARVVRFHPSSSLVASGWSDRSVLLWDVSSRLDLLNELFPGIFSGGDIIALSWHPDGTRLATGSRGGIMRFWNIVSGTQVFNLKAHKGWVRAVDYHPQSDNREQQLVTCSQDGTLKVWQSNVGRKSFSLKQTLVQDHPGLITVAYSPGDGKYLAFGGDGDFAIRIVDSETGVLRHELSGHLDRIYSVAWSPNGRFLASGSVDATVRIWDALRGPELLVLTGHKERVRSVAWSPDGVHVASGSVDRTILIWKLSGVL